MTRFLPGRVRICMVLLMVSMLFSAPERTQAKTLWIVLLPGTSLSQWQQANAPYLHEALATGAVAVMNMRTACPAGSDSAAASVSAALTLGAGSRATDDTAAAVFLPQDTLVRSMGVTAANLYIRRMGCFPPPGSLVSPQWPRILHANHDLGYDLRLGNLADTLSSKGVTVKAGGGLLADALASGSRGTVLPYTESAKTTGNQCVVWEAVGSLTSADQTIGGIMARIGQGELVILSPSTDNADQRQGQRLCPLVIWKRGIRPGLLRSASTRRLGLVTDTDFAPSIACFFGITNRQFPLRPFGSPWQISPAAHAVGQVMHLQNGAVTQWQGMHLLPYLALFLGAWMLLASLYRLFVRLLPPWAASVPPALIAAALFSVSCHSFLFWSAAALCSVFFIPRCVYFWLAAGALIVDLMLGSPLMHHSLLGYSAIEGARYYGIGNEAMGVLIGSSLIAADMAWRRLPPQGRIFLLLALVFIALLLVAPQAGAKAGGLLVALMTYGSYAWLRSGRRISAALLGIGFAATCALLLAAAYLDAHFDPHHASHLGQAVVRLQSGGFGEWTEIIARKLAVEGHLIWHSAWAVALWAGLGALLLRGRPLQGEDRPLFLAGLVAVVACLAVNDAGTVAASLCLVLLWSYEADMETARCLSAERQRAA